MPWTIINGQTVFVEPRQAPPGNTSPGMPTLPTPRAAPTNPYPTLPDRMPSGIGQPVQNIMQGIPQNGWAHSGPTAGFSFGNLDAKQDIFYNTPSNYGVGYQKLTDYLNPNNSSSNYGSWLASQAGEVQNRYNDALAMDPGSDLKWVDYLEKQAPGFRNMFQSLSARQRGENPALYDSGVYLG